MRWTWTTSPRSRNAAELKNLPPGASSTNPTTIAAVRESAIGLLKREQRLSQIVKLDPWRATDGLANLGSPLALARLEPYGMLILVGLIVFDKELRVSSRRRRNYLLRFCYLAALTILIGLILSSAFSAIVACMNNMGPGLNVSLAAYAMSRAMS